MKSQSIKRDYSKELDISDIYNKFLDIDKVAQVIKYKTENEDFDSAYEYAYVMRLKRIDLLKIYNIKKPIDRLNREIRMLDDVIQTLFERAYPDSKKSI